MYYISMYDYRARHDKIRALHVVTTYNYHVQGIVIVLLSMYTDAKHPQTDQDHSAWRAPIGPSGKCQRKHVNHCEKTDSNRAHMDRV